MTNPAQIEFLENYPDIAKVLDKIKKDCIMLLPHSVTGTLPFYNSKMGGIPNMNLFDTWPLCDECETHLNFVLQLYKKDFEQIYYPENSNIFQLFRCPNNDCPASYSQYYDHKMFFFYGFVSTKHNKDIHPTKSLSKEMEPSIPDCIFKPLNVEDHPNYDDFPDTSFNSLDAKYEDEVIDFLIDNFSAKTGTKIKGYPSWTQSPDYPKCNCGQIKSFFFQLSSEDLQEGQEYPPKPNEWSPHGIMIGDVGNIYFFICKRCGQTSIETSWDCY
jgi:uncharacterized protein YwqG